MPSEHQIQAAIVEWAYNTRLSNEGSEILIGDYLVAIPNGGYRHKSEGRKFKREGVKAGVSDLFLAIPVLSFDGYQYSFERSRHGLWIECKSEKGELSQAQHDWGRLMQGISYRFVCIHSVDEGIQAIKDYIGMKDCMRTD